MTPGDLELLRVMRIALSGGIRRIRATHAAGISRRIQVPPGCWGWWVICRRQSEYRAYVLAALSRRFAHPITGIQVSRAEGRDFRHPTSSSDFMFKPGLSGRPAAFVEGVGCSHCSRYQRLARRRQPS